MVLTMASPFGPVKTPFRHEWAHIPYGSGMPGGGEFAPPGTRRKEAG
jgi:hypothetical protein